jgi:hypothetical protein
MQAKVKADYRWKFTRSCGVEFVKSEFRTVPVGREQEAQRNEFLEIEASPEPEPAPEPEVKPEAKRSNRRKAEVKPEAKIEVEPEDTGEDE